MKLINIFKGAMVGVLALSMVSCEDFLNRPCPVAEQEQCSRWVLEKECLRNTWKAYSKDSIV